MFIRQPQFSGTFYPHEPEILRKMIENFLHQAGIEKLKKKPKAIIVPHAGYIYSGPIAAYGYKAISEFDYQNIILLGPSHNYVFEGLAFSPFKKWLTPLGEVESLTFLDFPLLKDNRLVNESAEAHQLEHSLEVQLPFLQVIFKKRSDYKILPLLTGEIDILEGKKIIESFLAEENLLIVSSDLSHYLPFNDALKQDKVTVDAILDLDLERFLEYGEACGKLAIAILIALARENGWMAKLLKLSNSGETEGGKEQVVGYASVIFI
ncbi:MAG: AmmeMemoRadiSam system protein B [Minisyncoccia bacterium]